MSNYLPAPPYGAYGSQPPQTSPPYIPSSYPNQYIQQDDGRAAQTHMASNYDTSMSAYGYNNSIPGFNAGSIAPTAPPLPIYQGWNQDPVPLPSYSNPQNNVQYAGYGGDSYQNQQSYAPPQPHTYHQNPHVAPYDEGELSEGEFDAYGGQHTGGGGAAASANYGPNYYHGTDGTGYMNTAHRAVYPSGHDYSNQHHSSGNDYNNYHRESDSYSPYAPSPLEAGQDERWRGKQNNNAYPSGAVTEQPANGAPWMQTNTTPSHTRSNGTAPKPLDPLQNPPYVSQPVNQIQSNSTSQAAQAGTKSAPIVQRTSTTEVANQAAEEGRTTPSAPIAGKMPAAQNGFPKSVAEARKKAEGAILNLWPYEVRFPNYVEEGMDENIVGRLFDDLGFSRAPKAAIAETKPMSDTPNGKGPDNASLGLLKVGGQWSAGVGDEARSVLVENSGNRVNTSVAATSTAQAKTEPTEKEKNLKMKMEALRKSREERAQKAAAKSNAQPAAAASTASQPELSSPPTTEPINSITTSPLPASQPTSDVQPATYPQLSTTVRPPTNVQPPSSTAQPSPPPQPVIPGLFLASNPSPAPPPITSTMFGVPPSNQRKRPVAADFDTPASTMPSKRPFGQSRNDSLVIDVSEEEPDSEDEDVAMDLESQADQDSPLQPVRKMSDHRAAALQNLPPLTNFPTRRAFISPPGSSAASTPPVHPGSKATPGHPHVLQQKEIEIALLKKQIADFEAAKAAKRRAQQTSSGAATPQHQTVNGASAANGNGDIASKVEASIQMQELIGIAEDKISSDQRKLAETQAAEQEKTAELKRNEAESRRLRREKIATDLPRVDAEVEQGQLRLRQLREEMAKQEAAIQKGLDDKRRMAEEMQRLGQEAEDDLQEKKDKLKVLTSAETANFSKFPHPVALPTAPTEIEQVGLSAGPVASNSASVSTKSISPPATSAQGETPLPNQGFGTVDDRPADSYADKITNAAHNEAVLASAAEGRRLYIGNLAYATTEGELQSFFKGFLIESTSIPKNPRTDRSVGYAFVNLSTTSEAERAIVELSGKKILDCVVSIELARKPERDTEKGDGGEAGSGGEGSRRPRTNGVLHRSSSTSDQALEAALQDQVGAEAESHEQSEEDMDIEDSYAPDPTQLAPESGSNSVVERPSSAAPESPARMDDGEVPADQLPNVQHDSTVDMEIDADEDDDDYEPPEATPPVDVPSLVESPPFSPAPPESVTDFEQFSFGRGGLEDTANAEELRVNGSVPTEGLAENSNQIQIFTPYESPLKYFRAFRFHPDYKQQVSGGLKSVTYSHKIDPNTELCRYELAGGVCNDKTCEFQHFRDIVLPDDTILSTLGNPEEFPVDQQQKFREGLRQVLTDLRSRKVRDFDTIAAEVVAHRSRFLGDPSKILMLEGITI